MNRPTPSAWSAAPWSRSYIPLAFLLLLVALLLAACSPQAEEPLTGDHEAAISDSTEAQKEVDVNLTYSGSSTAPDFPANLEWLNVEAPITFADLRGKVVLLDFWTYGCINCIHIIPDLEILEEKYADELVIIGVHSAKFVNEGESENIRRVIQRYELAHPVVNDKDFEVWRSFGARAWPTLVLIDPQGKVYGSHSGEGVLEVFDTLIGEMINEFDLADLIDRSPLQLDLEQDKLLNSPLLFPGKVLADGQGRRIFIADSNHNRVVVTNLDGEVLQVIGGGQAGFDDGDFTQATFDRPQGLALADQQTLYVADTENHAVRRVNLDSGQVETVAGIGEQVYMRTTSQQASGAGLNSPWDLLWLDNRLFVAMAGQHQIWVIEPGDNRLELYAGSGREELRDGQREEAGLNQPSGLTTDGETIFFADSEASAIRSISVVDEKVDTIVGTGLFDFGDVDGHGRLVRLQHPLGVAYLDGLLYVADTYNSKIKVVNPVTRDSVTLLGGDESGWQDGDEPLFDEPGGLSFGAGKLYIADTNNHAIRVYDSKSGTVRTLVLIDSSGKLTAGRAGDAASGRLQLPSQQIATGEGSIILDILLPEGYKINDLAPYSVDWSASNDRLTFGSGQESEREVNPAFPKQFQISLQAGETVLSGDLVVYYCDVESDKLCLIEQLSVDIPVTIGNGGSHAIELEHTITLPTGI